MLNFLKLLVEEWSDFYTSDTYETRENNNTRLSATSASYYIRYSTLDDFNNRAIEFLSTTASTCLLIEDILLSKCYNNDVAGALFFENNGQCVQNRVCSYQSKTNSNSEEKGGTYCFIDVSSSSPYQNKIIESSIVETGFKTGKGHASIYLNNGAVNITSVNESSTYTFSYCIHKINNINDKSCVKFCSYVDNNQIYTGYSTAIHYSSITDIELYIQNCNFKNNTFYQYLVNTHKFKAFLISCNFIKNVGTGGICGQYETGTLTVDCCYFDEFKSSLGSVIIHMTMNEQFHQYLPHLSTFNCHANFPLQYKNAFICQNVISDYIDYQCIQTPSLCIFILYLS